MKRSILTGLALLAFAATIQAQSNTATVDQNGNSQGNTVVQTGTANQTIIRQLTGTSAVVNTGNVAGVTQQANPAGPQANQAFVDQLNGADYNKAVIGQSDGSGNIGTIQQNGGGVNGFRSGGSALLGTTPVGSRAGLGNDARITQIGEGNDQTMITQNAGADGGSRANEAVIEQTGDANLNTVIEQSNNSSENVARITQGATSGGATGNNAVVLQNDNSQRNQATVSQEGADKVAEVLQITRSSFNTAQVSQVGTDGTANVYQTDDSQYNQATIQQAATSSGTSFGMINQATFSAYNQATIEQAGITDVASINQSEQSANNVALIQQGIDGMGNSAVITQTYASDAIGSSYGSGNSARVKQNLTALGGGNQVELTQGFAGGTSTVTGQAVVSDNNQATMSQEGEQHVAKLLQGGLGNQATVGQSGTGHVLKGVNAGMTINDTAQQIGNLNQLNVMQSGTAGLNTANVSQIGNSNVGQVGQTNQ